jgi:phage tail-like protein
METDDQYSPVSHYVDYLPTILQADPFVGKFLLAFESVMSGLSPRDRGDKFPKGLEEYIDNIHTYFNPGLQEGSDTAPSEFLPWLAGWVALSLRDEWKEETKRQFISQIVPLYRLRGTKAGLEKILTIYLESSDLPTKVEVMDEFDNLPQYFQVQLTSPDAAPENYWRMARIAKAIIDQEKPAHTYYALQILVRTMRLTGNIYRFALKQPGTITATVEQQRKPLSRVRLSIKADLGQVNPNVQKIGSDERLKVTYDVTQQEFNLNKSWHVIIDNLSDKELIVNITVKESDLSQPRLLDKKPEKLEPRLRIGMDKEDKGGNKTVVGTETSR